MKPTSVPESFTAVLGGMPERTVLDLRGRAYDWFSRR